MVTGLIPLADWLAATDGLENTCGNPACKDYHDHSSGEIRSLGAVSPLPAALAIKKEGK